MAIAIPLIGGVREAANNAKCRSNLKQLHTAIIAFSTSNEERLPNLQSDLESLTDGGYIESESKLGICPGAGAKPELPISSYAGGPDLDGMKKLSSAGINSNTIILADAEKENHKAGKNSIRLDGSFTQSGGGGTVLAKRNPEDNHATVYNAIVAGNLNEVTRLLSLDPPLENINETIVISANDGNFNLNIFLALLLQLPYNDLDLDNEEVGNKIREIVEILLANGADPDFAPDSNNPHSTPRSELTDLFFIPAQIGTLLQDLIPPQ